MKKIYVAIIVILILIAGTAFCSYSRLSSLNTEVNDRLTQIETQIHAKGEITPKLVASVKDYTAGEEAAFTKIAEAQAKVEKAKTIEELQAANEDLDNSVSRLLKLAETYPELKANEAYNAAKDEMEKANEKLRASRMDYNAAVQKMNTRIKSLPDSIFAGPLGYYNKEYFKEVAGSQNLPEINY